MTECFAGENIPEKGNTSAGILPACGEGLGEEHRSSKPCLGAEGEAGAKSSSADPQNIIGGKT